MSVELNAHVLERMEVTPALTILRVAPDGWELPEFEAGQFAVLGLPYGAARCDLAIPEETVQDADKLIKRAYSIASSSVAKQHLELYPALVPSESLTPHLFALQSGDRLWLGRKISGMFTLDEVPAEKQLVLIATGTGLAPYVSMLHFPSNREKTANSAEISSK